MKRFMVETAYYVLMIGLAVLFGMTAWAFLMNGVRHAFPSLGL